jgi:ABC-type branched-subunit amino acid transport system substrate-binding protein
MFCSSRLRARELFARAADCLLQTVAGLFFAAVVAISAADDAIAAEAEAAGVRHKIAVFFTSSADGCHLNGSAKAIEAFVSRRVAEINASPEFPNQSFRADLYDDMGDPDRAIANMRRALADPTVVAMVGLSGSARAKSVFDAVGKEIAASNIPFLSDVSLSSIYRGAPNVFTMRPSQEEERVPVIGRFLQDGKYQRPAFVGSADSIGVDAFLEVIGKLPGAPAIAAAHRLEVKDGKYPIGAASAIIDDIKAKQADLLIVALGTSAGTQFLKDANASGLSTPVLFVFGNEALLRSPEAGAYGNDLYQLTWDALPDVYNNRLRERMLQNASANWIFEDTKNTSAAGWSTGKCKEKPASGPPSILSGPNLRAISRGTQYADMIGLVGEAARATYIEQSTPVFRADMLAKLKSDYIAGSGAYRGDFDNWSFREGSRSASRTPSILMRQRGAPNMQLAPTQYVRLRNDALRPIQTVYMDIDVVRVFRVDDDEKSFFAEFYMSMRATERFSLSNIEFGNAFLDADEGGPKVTTSVLHDGSPSGVYPEGVTIAKVVGKFMMSPDLSKYPFDTQLFSIQLQPKSGDAAFIIQPPHESLRDRASRTDGWTILDQYVGYDEDYVPVIDARAEQRSIVPFYKMNFSWVMKRAATDYYLRVVIPLAFILIVGYLSIFIPREHFEAIVTIQVTALLSAVALYLSIPKVGSDDATISDRIFLFDYMAVSLMIAISILRVNPRLRPNRGLQRVVVAAHIFGVPLLVAGMALYVSQLDTGYLPNVTISQEPSWTATKGQP